MVQRTIQQKKEVKKGALMEILEEPMMKEEVEDTPEEDPICSDQTSNGLCCCAPVSSLDQ